MILADYRMQQNQSGFDLRHFVNVNFTLPKEGEKYVPPEGNHCANILTDLAGINAFYRKHRKMGFLLPLPKPYVARADVFREVYYWEPVTSPC